MNTDLHWVASQTASSLHAAEVVASGRALTDPNLQQLLAGPAAALDSQFQTLRIAAPNAWSHLIALSAGIHGNRELADVTLRKVVGGAQSSTAAALAGKIADVKAAFARGVPNGLDQLELRSRPLREQWESRGPGLLRSFGRHTDEQLVVQRASVIVVHPVLGGAGRPHLLYNSVRIEAMLANPVPQLPEVLRLGWLLAQLNFELPRFSERVPARRLPLIAQLASLPPLLQAAEDVELAALDERTVRLALDTWIGDGRPSHPTIATAAGVDSPSDDRSDFPRLLLDWWITYCATRPAWSVALHALDQMTESEGDTR